MSTFKLTKTLIPANTQPTGLVFMTNGLPTHTVDIMIVDDTVNTTVLADPGVTFASAAITGAAASNTTSGQLITKITSDVINNNAVANTIADITGLSFPVTSAKTYLFRFIIIYSSAATTTGARFSINGPATTTLAYKSEYSLTTTTTTFNEGLSAYNLPAASNLSSAATTGNIAIIQGILIPSASGTVIGRFASEVASSAITVKAGSFVEFREI